MGSGLKQIYSSVNIEIFRVFLLGKNISSHEIYSLLSKIIQFFDLFNTVSTFSISIALVLVLLFFENMTNSNTVLTVGIVFQYNTSRNVHLWF
jgi:hypothetical protein